MFRDRPLTWLFVIATICADIALKRIENDQVFATSTTVGLVLGQLAAIAIWTVRGWPHRLLRVSCLVVVTGLLNDLFPDSARDPSWFAFCSGYVLIIVAVTMLSDFASSRLGRNPYSDEPIKRWQISLIECFGWTLVVSVISFGARHMDFTFFLQSDALLMSLVLLAVPVFTALLIRRDLRGLQAIRAIGIVLVAIVASHLLANFGPDGAYTIFIQAAYLALWLAVLGMDGVKASPRSVHESPQDENLQINEPKLFDSQD